MSEKITATTETTEKTIPTAATDPSDGKEKAPVTAPAAKDSNTLKAPTDNTADTELRKFLASYGAPDSAINIMYDLGVEKVEDVVDLTADELVEAGIKLIQARKMLKQLKAETPAPEAPTARPAPAVSPMATFNMDGILPALPDEGSWLEALKTGGVLKVNDATYIGAIRAAMAHRCGLYNVPDILLKKLEEYAESLDEPVGPDFYKIRKLITRRDYAEIFSAIDDVDGRFATTKERRAKFLKNVDAILWPAIKTAFDALDAWYSSARALMTDPSTFMAMVTGQSAGGFGVSVPPFDSVSSACDDLKDQINRVFRGTAMPVSAALAYDAKKINEVLSDSSLPAQVGAGNRDQMLKMLGLSINSAYTRQEQCIVRFVLSYIKFNDNAVGNEMQYLSALWQLGRQINWDSLGFSGSSGRQSSFSGSSVL